MSACLFMFKCPVGEHKHEPALLEHLEKMRALLFKEEKVRKIEQIEKMHNKLPRSIYPARNAKGQCNHFIQTTFILLFLYSLLFVFITTLPFIYPRQINEEAISILQTSIYRFWFIFVYLCLHPVPYKLKSMSIAICT